MQPGATANVEGILTALEVLDRRARWERDWIDLDGVLSPFVAKVNDIAYGRVGPGSWPTRDGAGEEC